MTQPTAIPYASPQPRPGWVLPLGSASVVHGFLCAIAGLIRSRDAYEHVYDRTFRWLYPPPAWVPPAFLLALVGQAVAFLLIAMAGIVLLTQGRPGIRFHLVAATLAICFVSLTVVAGALQWLRHPGFSGAGLVVDGCLQLVVFGGYPALVLWFCSRKLRHRPPNLLAA